MDWREHDWAELDEQEQADRQSAGGTSTRSPGTRTRRIALALGLIAAIAVAVYAAGHYPRTHPLVPGLAFGLPGISRASIDVGARFAPHVRIGSSTARFRSTYTLTGTTRARTPGPVRAEGSWNGGPWQLLASARSADGRYRVSFPLDRHGALRLRVRFPGGEADGSVFVR